MTNLTHLVRIVNWSPVNRVSLNRSNFKNFITVISRYCSTKSSQRLNRTNPVVTKIHSTEFNSIFDENVNHLISVFAKHNYELRIVGGAVRDLLLDHVPTDLDFATTATPTQMKEMFTRESIRIIKGYGERHGTVTPRINDKQNFDVTTLHTRVGRKMEWEFSFTTDWQSDAQHRDLTINAMYLGFDGTVYDYFNGHEDLMQRRVRFVGDANMRIQEDYTRILRYFRFFGQIAASDSHHDRKALDAIKDNISGLEEISGQRLWAEMKKIFESNKRSELIETLLELGAAKYIGLPEDINLDDFQRVSQNSRHLPAISYMSAFLRSGKDASVLDERLALSVYERELSAFLATHGRATRHIDDLLHYQCMCVAGKNQSATKKYVLELLSYNNKPELFEQLQRWKPPRFPITKEVLDANGASQQKIVSELKSIWAKANFQMTEEDLLKELPGIRSKQTDSDNVIKKSKKKGNAK